MEELDDAIDAAILKPSYSSGHAFVLFDSLKTTKECLKKFSYELLLSLMNNNIFLSVWEKKFDPTAAMASEY